MKKTNKEEYAEKLIGFSSHLIRELEKFGYLHRHKLNKLGGDDSMRAIQSLTGVRKALCNVQELANTFITTNEEQSI